MKDIRISIIASIGGALEFYDFIIYIYLSHTISKVFFSSITSPLFSLFMTYMVFAIGYVARPLGGILLAHFGDKHGRKNTFTLILNLMGVSSIFIGILPAYTTIGIFAPILLLLFRLTQGLALGGEVPCSAIYLYEIAEKKRRGFNISIFYSGLVLGTLIGSAAGMIITYIFKGEDLLLYGWRIPFIFGGILAFIGVYLRKRLSETPAFVDLRERNIKERIPILTVFKQYKVSTLKGFTINLTEATCTLIYFVFLPTYLKTYFNYSTGSTFTINTIALVFAILFTIFGGVLSLKYNIKKIYLVGSIITFLVSIFFIFVIPDTKNWFWGRILLMLIPCFGIGLMQIYPCILAKLFPAQNRISGYSVCNNCSFIITGFIPAFTVLLYKIFNITFTPFYILCIFLTLNIILVISLIIKNNNNKTDIKLR